MPSSLKRSARVYFQHKSSMYLMRYFIGSCSLWLLLAFLAKTETHMLVLCCCQPLEALCVFSLASQVIERLEQWLDGTYIEHHHKLKSYLWNSSRLQVPLLLPFFLRANHSWSPCVVLLEQGLQQSLILFVTVCRLWLGLVQNPFQLIPNETFRIPAW